MLRNSLIYFSLAFLLGLQIVFTATPDAQELKKSGLVILPLDFVRVTSGSQTMKGCSKNTVLT